MPWSGRKIHLLYIFHYSRHNLVKNAAGQWPLYEQEAEKKAPPPTRNWRIVKSAPDGPLVRPCCRAARGYRNIIQYMLKILYEISIFPLLKAEVVSDTKGCTG